jgi:hypothetical protein
MMVGEEKWFWSGSINRYQDLGGNAIRYVLINDKIVREDHGNPNRSMRFLGYFL